MINIVQVPYAYHHNSIETWEENGKLVVGRNKGREETTIKGGSRRAEKSCKVLMMMKAAKRGWAGAGQEQTMSRPVVGREQARSNARAEKKQK